MVQLPLESVVSEPAAAVDTESVSKQRTLAPDAGSSLEVAAAALPSLLKRLLPPLLLLVSSVPLSVAFATVVPVSVLPVSVLPVSVLPVSVVPVSVLLVTPPPPPLQPAAISVPTIIRVSKVRKTLLLPVVLITISFLLLIVSD